MLEASVQYHKGRGEGVCVRTYNYNRAVQRQAYSVTRGGGIRSNWL